MSGISSGSRAITGQTLAYLRSEPDLQARIDLPSNVGRGGAVTVEQIFYHLAGEEMIHLGEVLAMTRQVGIDLPAYFLMSVMDATDRPWETWAEETEGEESAP